MKLNEAYDIINEKLSVGTVAKMNRKATRKELKNEYEKWINAGFDNKFTNNFTKSTVFRKGTGLDSTVLKSNLEKLREYYLKKGFSSEEATRKATDKLIRSRNIENKIPNKVKFNNSNKINNIENFIKEINNNRNYCNFDTNLSMELALNKINCIHNGKSETDIIDDTKTEPRDELCDEEIEKMKKDAELHADEDKKKREMIDLKNTADTMIYTTEKMMKDVEEKKVPCLTYADTTVDVSKAECEMIKQKGIEVETRHDYYERIIK
jgi:hypothetical protein